MWGLGFSRAVGLLLSGFKGFGVLGIWGVGPSGFCVLGLQGLGGLALLFAGFRALGLLADFCGDVKGRGGGGVSLWAFVFPGLYGVRV